MTYVEIRAQAAAEADRVEARELRKALRARDWWLGPTAQDLRCSLQTLSAAVARHPELARRVRGRGRPRKRPESRRKKKSGRS